MSRPHPGLKFEPGGNSDPEHSGTERCSSVCLHPGKDVLVHAHGEGGARVAEAFAHDLHRDAGLQQDRGMSVSEIVEPDRSQFAVAHHSLP